jgi:hypothetical protein
MKRTILFTGLLTAFLFAGDLSAQTTCQVLLPGLKGTYTGDCKAGLADGSGEAIGVDFYKGEFVKGLPEGEGTYLWSNGAVYIGEWKNGLRHGNGKYEFKYHDKDSVLMGEWKNDKFLGKKTPPPYLIEYRTGIGRVSCFKVGDRPYVKYKFSRAGGESYSINNLFMQSSSGSERTNSDFTGYEQVEFPFWGKITFTAPNAWYTATISCELRLTINEPGAWIVTISY